MTDYLIREYRLSDKEAIIRLWREVFGDKREYIEYFLDNLPRLGIGMIAEKEGLPCAMAYAVTALRYKENSIAYIYAVATAPSERGNGLGEKLCQALEAHANADVLTTLPAEESLYSWYNKILSLNNRLFIEEKIVYPCSYEPCKAIATDEYNKRREELLSGTEHITLLPAAIELSEALCITYDGGLYSCDGTILASYMDGDILYVREALGGNVMRAVSSLTNTLGAKKAIFRTASECGKPFIAFRDSSLSKNAVWNLSFD